VHRKWGWLVAAQAKELDLVILKWNHSNDDFDRYEHELGCLAAMLTVKVCKEQNLGCRCRNRRNLRLRHHGKSFRMKSWRLPLH
jgi:hypothetical protein